MIIDGEVFHEDYIFLFYDSFYINMPAFKVPANQATPIQYTIVIDPYNQLEESDETNNTATINIPIQNSGTAGPDFSIMASDLSYISKPILPGSEVIFSAAIFNNSNSYPAKNLHVHFKIKATVDGITREIKSWNFTVLKNLLHPLQYYLLTQNWNVPQDLPDNSVFEVELDPDREFAADNISDNKASITLNTFGSDLEVTTDGPYWSPTEPMAGQTITLYAGVRNNGLKPVSNCITRFIIDGINLGEPVITSIPGVSGSVISQPWQRM